MGNAAISKMQIAHFLDFVSANLDKGWDEGQNCLCSLKWASVVLPIF